MTPPEFRAALKELGITQERFAVAIGVGRRAVQKWVGGEVPLPRYAIVILRLMQRFELSIEDIEVAG